MLKGGTKTIAGLESTGGRRRAPHHHNTTLNNTAAEGGKAEETMHITLHIVITYIILRQTFLLCFDLVLLANYDEYKIFDGII